MMRILKKKKKTKQKQEENLMSKSKNHFNL